MQLSLPFKCSEVGRREVLEALIKHELCEEDENRVLEHLRICPKCLSEMASVIGQIVSIHHEGYDICSLE